MNGCVGFTCESNVNVDQHCVALRIGDVSLRDRVCAALRSIDLAKGQRRWIGQLESMDSVVNLIFNLLRRYRRRVAASARSAYRASDRKLPSSRHQQA